MHYQRNYNYEYPLYKRSSTEDMQVLPRGAFGVPAGVYLQPKYAPSPAEYELRASKTGEEAAGCSEFYYQKDLHDWEKNCSCGILTSEYRNPVEFQIPILTRAVQMRAHQSPYSSQSNIYPGPTPSTSRTNTDDCPLWLKIYSRASNECDHKLHWDMFNIRDLFFFDNVLMRLYDRDLAELILWFNYYKNALLREIDKRLLEANQQRQKILMYNT